MGLSKRPASEPDWTRGAQSRLDDPAGATPGAATFGVRYAGQDPETAFCESVIHENSLFFNGVFVVSKAGLVARLLVGFKHPNKPAPTLADLIGAALKTLGLNTTSPPATTTASRRPGQRPFTSRALSWTASATSAGSATMPFATLCLTAAESSPTELRPRIHGFTARPLESPDPEAAAAEYPLMAG